MNFSWLRIPLNRNNNFDLIRLFAAFQVVVTHGIHHFNPPVSSKANILIYPFSGVPVFFFLSGMLVTYSLAMSGSRTEFYAKRLRRIFPGLLFAFVLAFAVLVALGRITGQTLLGPEFWGWAVGQLSFVQWLTPSFLSGLPYGMINNSLWTISVEVSFYAALPFIVWLSCQGAAANDEAAARRRLTWIVALPIVPSFLLKTHLSNHEQTLSLGERILSQTFVPYFWMFGMGILAYVHHHAWMRVVKKKAALFLLATVFVSWYGARHPAVFQPCSFVAFVLLCLSTFAVGFAVKPVAQKVLRGWDLSYGVYLYHMILVNVLLALGWRYGWISILGVLAVVLPLAAFSWRFVEKPAMRGRKKPSLAVETGSRG